MSENASETEKNIVNDIADIRDELAMIDDVLRQQETVIEKFMRILEEKEANDDATDKQSILRAKRDTESSRRTLADYRQRIVKIDKDYVPEEIERKQVFGVTFEQGRNNFKIDRALLSNIVTKNKELPEDKAIDLIISLITLKYTQSNSVCFAADGQAIGRRREIGG